MDKEFFEIWVNLTAYGIATNEEIGLVTALNGHTIEVLNDILYIRTGCRNLEQFFEDYNENWD